MNSAVLMRAGGVLLTGAAGYECIRRTATYATHSATLPTHSAPHRLPSVSLTHVGWVAAAGLLYVGFRTPYVTARQFQTTCDALQTQITTVSNALGKVKHIVLTRFKHVDTRLDDIERTVLTKTAEIKRDIAHLETLVAKMGGQITDIQSHTDNAANGVQLLCHVVASSLDNTLVDKQATADRLHKHALPQRFAFTSHTPPST